MSRKPDSLPPTIAALLASERALPPQSEQRRSRVLARAHNALAAAGASRSQGWILPRVRGRRWLAAVSAGIVTAAAWAAVREVGRKPPPAPAPLVPAPPAGDAAAPAAPTPAPAPAGETPP